MRRPRVAVIPPEYFDSGEIGNQTAGADRYFTSTSEPTLRIMFDHFLSKLPEPQKSAVEMCIMSGITYEQAAEYISVDRGANTDRKTVWRWAQQGVEMLGKMLNAAGWTAAISPKVPDCE